MSWLFDALDDVEGAFRRDFATDEADESRAFLTLLEEIRQYLRERSRDLALRFPPTE